LRDENTKNKKEQETVVVSYNFKIITQ